MKTPFIFILCILFSKNIFASSQLGINLYTAYSLNDNRSFELNIGPVYSYINKKNKEKLISIGYLTTSSIFSQNDEEYQFKQSGFWAEVGFYRPVFISEQFKFSLGPNFILSSKFDPKTTIITGGSNTEISPSNYSTFHTGIRLPLNYDFFINEKLMMRFSAKIFSFNINYSNGVPGFDFELKTVFLPTFMLLYQL